MITINSLEDLEKYKFQIISKKQDKKFKVKTYKFMENDKLADVTFNIEIPFGFLDLQTTDTVKVTKRKRTLPNIEFKDPICYAFGANNIVANEKFRVGRIYVNNAKFYKDAEIYSELRAKGKVEAKKLECVDVKVLCGEMVCDDLIVDDITCGKLKAKSLITSHNQFENITAENVNMFYDLMRNSNR